MITSITLLYFKFNQNRAFRSLLLRLRKASLRELNVSMHRVSVMGREVRREGDPQNVPISRDWMIAFAFFGPFSVFFHVLFLTAF